MRLVNFEVEFKKDMSNIEIAGVEAIIGKQIFNDGEIYGVPYDDLGLIYSSTGGFAMLGTNDDMYFMYDDEALSVNYFAITDSNLLIMVCKDDNENEIVFEIQASEF